MVKISLQKFNANKIPNEVKYLHSKIFKSLKKEVEKDAAKVERHLLFMHQQD